MSNFIVLPSLPQRHGIPLSHIIQTQNQQTFALCLNNAVRRKARKQTLFICHCFDSSRNQTPNSRSPSRTRSSRCTDSATASGSKQTSTHIHTVGYLTYGPRSLIPESYQTRSSERALTVCKLLERSTNFLNVVQTTRMGYDV